MPSQLFKLTTDVHRVLLSGSRDGSTPDIAKIPSIKLANAMSSLLTALDSNPDTANSSAHETDADAFYYYNKNFEKYAAATFDAKVMSFAQDLDYWSDRWCYSRAFTCKKVWMHLLETWPV